MTGRKTENFSKALYGTTGGTYSARIIRPVMAICCFKKTDDYIHHN